VSLESESHSRALAARGQETLLQGLAVIRRPGTNSRTHLRYLSDRRRRYPLKRHGRGETVATEWEVVDSATSRLQGFPSTSSACCRAEP
jgi:hypothetical protein